jgi:hypothetical protein
MGEPPRINPDPADAGVNFDPRLETDMQLYQELMNLDPTTLKVPDKANGFIPWIKMGDFGLYYRKLFYWYSPTFKGPTEVRTVYNYITACLLLVLHKSST